MLRPLVLGLVLAGAAAPASAQDLGIPLSLHPSIGLPSTGAAAVHVPTLLELLHESGDFDQQCRETYRTAWLGMQPIDGPLALDIVLGLPCGVMTLINDGWRGLVDPGGCRSVLDDRNRSALAKILDATDYEAEERPGRAVLQLWGEREVRYFSKIADSDAIPIGYILGLEDLDADVVKDGQRKLLFDVAKKVYFSRGFGQIDDRIRHDGFNVSSWRAMDFVAAPPVLAAYLYLRGWEKPVNFGPVRAVFHLEPVQKILDRRSSDSEDLVTAAGLEIGVRGLPVKFLVSAGLHDGDMEIDFIGIGTSLGKAKQAVRTEHDIEDSRDR